MTPKEPLARQDMGALAERCEAATGPDRELDLLIMRYAMNIGGAAENADRYTASLDAAMTLLASDDQALCDFVLNRPSAVNVGNTKWVHGATPALALCAAALRARATMEASNE